MSPSSHEISELWKLVHDRPDHPLERKIVLGLITVLVFSFVMVLVTR